MSVNKRRRRERATVYGTVQSSASYQDRPPAVVGHRHPLLRVDGDVCGLPHPLVAEGGEEGAGVGGHLRDGLGAPVDEHQGVPARPDAHAGHAPPLEAGRVEVAVEVKVAGQALEG